MKRIDVKEHTRRYNDMAKKAQNGDYPSPRVAKIGSEVGTGIGIILMIIGVIGVMKGTLYGFGSFIAGSITVVSNYYNLKRIKEKTN